MRRLGMILFATFCIAALGFSQGKNDHLISEINYDRLSQYLQLKPSQMNDVYAINTYFNDQLRKASFARESSFNGKLYKAVYGNLKLMKKALNQEQYRKYLVLINEPITITGCLQKRNRLPILQMQRSKLADR